ncbi:STN domain-containing protein [Aliidongia dinghuensis]|uniref:STN domain-containing protein n=1 Tax=Aliidongia dinghuensis TaxID=1867774 RepID=UPI00166C7DAB|nr:STN domain-containing protein [Aliidongia dinghuensis]
MASELIRRSRLIPPKAADRFLAACLGALLSTGAAAAQPNEVVAFDIPAQPLASALKAYGAAVPVQLFYDTDLVRGRQSSPVHGAFPSEAALHALLRGTGLSAASFDQGTVTILALPPRTGPMVDLQPAKARTMPFMPYLALVQAGLRSALCLSPATRLDPLERRFQLWLAPSGAVARAELLTPTGSSDRDRAYADALQTISIGEPPPSSMPEPVTLLILPRTTPDAAECSGSDQPAAFQAGSHG